MITSTRTQPRVFSAESPLNRLLIRLSEEIREAKAEVNALLTLVFADELPKPGPEQRGQFVVITTIVTVKKRSRNAWVCTATVHALCRGGEPRHVWGGNLDFGGAGNDWAMAALLRRGGGDAAGHDVDPSPSAGSGMVPTFLGRPQPEWSLAPPCGRTASCRRPVTFHGQN